MAFFVPTVAGTFSVPLLTPLYGARPRGTALGRGDDCPRRCLGLASGGLEEEIGASGTKLPTVVVGTQLTYWSGRHGRVRRAPGNCQADPRPGVEPYYTLPAQIAG